MITIEIPGREALELTSLVLDFNGTIAVGGKLIDGVKERLVKLSDSLEIHVLTADTFGTAKAECEGTNAVVDTFPKGQASIEKEAILQSLGGGVVAVGNGFNDIQMFDAADLSIAVIEGEGACARLLMHADVVCTSINDALDLLIDPSRLKATLRW